MTRFYLNIRNGAGYSADLEGQDMPDVQAAHVQAIDGIRSVVSEEVRNGKLDLTGSIEITDTDGNLLLIVPFREAVEIEL